MDLEKRKTWSLLRYEYYLTGRNAILIGNYNSAGIMLGYAVETSLKHALIESGCNDDRILNKHDPRPLLRECKCRGILPNLEVSEDFLDYINDFHKPRYPSLADEVNRDLATRGLTKIIGPLLLSWYDDLLFQIDQWIFEATKDRLSSCFFRATGDVLFLKGKIFFYANYHACMALENLTKMRYEHDGEESFEVQELRKGISYLWKSISGFLPPEPYEQAKYEKNFCKRFFYSKSADVAPLVITNTAEIIINRLPWE